MALLPFLAKKPLLAPDAQEAIVEAIRGAEKKTSGEIRVFVESRCKYVEPLDRAAEIFHGLKMEATENRNAVLVYAALKDRQLAVFADEGIYQKAGGKFWTDAVAVMLSHFSKDDYAKGLTYIVNETGNALQFHFPYDGATDKNELPDDIVFGK